MEKITGNEPAFPFWEYNQDGYGYSVVFTSYDIYQNILPFNRGLTIRQFMAAKVMAALISGPGFVMDSGIHEIVAQEAVKFTDELISRLNSTPNPNE